MINCNFQISASHFENSRRLEDRVAQDQVDERRRSMFVNSVPVLLRFGFFWPEPRSVHCQLCVV